MNTEGIRYTHPMPDRIGKKFVGTLATGAGRRGGHREDHRHHRAARAGRGARQTGTDDGKVVGLVSAGITVDQRRAASSTTSCRCCSAPRPASLALDHRRHRAGQQAAAAPDPRPRPGRDDPDVRAPRRGAARRTRGRAHRRRRRPAAARQRRGAPAARPARRTPRGATVAELGLDPRHRRAAGLRAGRHRRGAPGRRPAAGRQPALHGPGTAARPAASRRCATPPSCGR